MVQPIFVVTFPEEISVDTVETLREFTAALLAAPSVETDEKPDSVEIGQSAKGVVYIKSVKSYHATDATPEEIADRVKGVFDAVDAKLHPAL